jgi:hypothetical protein
MIEGVLADESVNRKVYEGYEHLRRVALLWKTLPRAGLVSPMTPQSNADSNATLREDLCSGGVQVSDGRSKEASCKRRMPQGVRWSPFLIDSAIETHTARCSGKGRRGGRAGVQPASEPHIPLKQ